MKKAVKLISHHSRKAPLVQIIHISRGPNNRIPHTNHNHAPTRRWDGLQDRARQVNHDKLNAMYIVLERYLELNALLSNEPIQAFGYPHHHKPQFQPYAFAYVDIPVPYPYIRRYHILTAFPKATQAHSRSPTAFFTGDRRIYPLGNFTH